MTDDPTTEDRQHVGRLFATARRTGLFSHPEPEPEPAAKADNVVPREGATSPGSIAHDDSHEFIRNLFSH